MAKYVICINFVADKWDSQPEMRSFSPISCSSDGTVDFGKKYVLREEGVLFKIKPILHEIYRNIKVSFNIRNTSNKMNNGKKHVKT